jgi:hypothetical protein
VLSSCHGQGRVKMLKMIWGGITSCTSSSSLLTLIVFLRALACNSCRAAVLRAFLSCNPSVIQNGLVHSILPRRIRNSLVKFRMNSGFVVVSALWPTSPPHNPAQSSVAVLLEGNLPGQLNECTWISDTGPICSAL